MLKENQLKCKEQVDSLSDEYSRERTKFKKEILIKWRNMNSSEGNARQVCNGHGVALNCTEWHKIIKITWGSKLECKFYTR